MGISRGLTGIRGVPILADVAQEADRPLTVKQVADLLGVAPSTVVNYADEGKLKHWKLPSGHRRFARRDIEPFMAPEPETAA